MQVATSASEVVDLFAVTDAACHEYRRWANDPKRLHVPQFVMKHDARVLYALRPEDIKAFEVPGRCEHPLGDIQKHEVSTLRRIVNWRPDFAFTHVLHYALETLGGMPAYQDFRDFCRTDSRAAAMLYEPSEQAIRKAVDAGTDIGLARRSVRWRIGNAYYSFLREAYTIAVLRDDGRDVRGHPLADALFRVDAWLGRSVLSMYVRNPEFRDGESGRKVPAEKLLTGATPAFAFEPFPLDIKHVYGRVHLPEPDQIRAVGRRLAAKDASHGV